MAGEATLARRIAMERESRDWTYDRLASRMTEMGCPIQSSAIFKIEKGDPPRRITVDELLAFAAVFETTVMDMLRPREVVINAKMTRLFDKWEEARRAALAANQRTDAAFAELSRFVQEQHSDVLEAFYDMVGDWSADVGDSPAEAEAVRAMVLARAVPVKPFKELERAAIDALAAERRGRVAD